MFMMRFDMRAPGATPDERAALYRTAIDMAAWAETRGCVSIVISEHHAADDGYLPSPLTFAASMAAVTSKVPIMIAAALLPLYDPVRLAEEMMVLDHISRGRVMYTLAIGYRREEYALYGVDFDRRGAIADKKLSELLGHVRGGSALTPKSFTPGGPMIAWGGGTKAAAQRAGRNGLGFLAQGGPPGLREAYEAAAIEAGHQPGMCHIPDPNVPNSVFVHDDLDAGWREVGEALLADAVSYADWNANTGATDMTASLSRGRTVEALRHENGSHRVVSVADAFQLIRANGMLALQPLCGGLSPDVAWPYLRRVVDDVLPSLAN
jgi:alkanesulfonate monooxygenase SsuD/methylene tetrahydromethanopterin reductase-like flavin-dependent oxidoreductase (luciferase family)